MAGASLPGMNDRFAAKSEHLACTLEVARGPADHDRQRGVFCADGRASDRRVDKGNAPARESLGRFPADIGIAARRIDPECSFTEMRKELIDDLVDLTTCRQHRDDDGSGSRFADVSREMRPMLA